MSKEKREIRRPLSLAIEVSMMGRRRRLTEQVAIHALVRGRIPLAHDHECGNDVPRPRP